MLWASVFQFLRRESPGRSPLTDAAGVTALAAVVDYAVVPKRLTPGWEKVVSPAAIALAYGAMMIGLIATCPPGKTMRARN
jgi:drug/metabolite transporter (DMT)-like permease